MTPLYTTTRYPKNHGLCCKREALQEISNYMAKNIDIKIMANNAVN